MGNCCIKLKESLNTLTSKERILADFILERPSDVVNMSISEFSEACGTSVSTVVRLCKSTGYNGFKAFCRDLAHDVAQAEAESCAYGDILPGSSLDIIVKAVCTNDSKAIENTLGVLDMKSLEKAIDVMSKATRIDFYGAGTSGYVAMDAYSKFSKIGKISMSSMDPPQQIFNAFQMKEGDVAFLISYTGNTKSILDCAETAKKAGATLISLTKYSKNPLAKLSDINLYSSSADDAIVRSSAMSSRIGLLTVIDIVFTAIVSNDFHRVKHMLDISRETAFGKYKG